MKRILVIGSGGAGKTTFAKHLSKKLSLPLTHLDAHFWNPGWTKTPTEEWNQIVHELCSKSEWVMDGNFASSLDIRLKRADTVIFLDFGRVLCTYRAFKRFFLNIGKVRDDMGAGCKEHLDLEFLKWVWNFPINSRPRIISALNNRTAPVKIHTIASRKELKQFIKEL